MTRNDEIRRDLGLKLSADIERLIQRDLDLAQRVLPPADVVIMIFSAAMGVTSSALSMALQARRPGEEPGAMLDSLVATIATGLIEQKPKILDGLSLIESGNVAEALRKYGSGAGR